MSSGANVFYFDQGLRLLDVPLALDVCRRQSCGFVSHAHSDHVGRHDLTLCTPGTARLIAARWGSRPVRTLDYHTPVRWGSCELTALPAGHILGSAMLRVDNRSQSLLYTGDFRLRACATCEPAEVVSADILIMECTFGHPRFRFPSHEELVEPLLECVRKSLAVGRLPVLHAYALGKAQDITRTLTRHNIPVMIHPELVPLHAAYVSLGVDLGAYRPYDPACCQGHVLIVPPRGMRAERLALPAKTSDIILSGWCLDPQYRERVRGHYYLPWSDHADYDELLECAGRVGARHVYCLHGQRDFVEDLRRRGHAASWAPAMRAGAKPRPLPPTPEQAP